MKRAILFFLLSIPLVSLRCTEPCDNYMLGEGEVEIILAVDPLLTYVNADQSDTIRITPKRMLDQGPSKQRKSWTKGYRNCGASATMDYGNSTAVPYFRVLFDLNKQHSNAIEIPSLQVGRLFLKKNYEDNRLKLFSDSYTYTIDYVGETTFNGHVVKKVYILTGTAGETGNYYTYDLFEGLLRIEEQGKSWERIWEERDQ